MKILCRMFQSIIQTARGGSFSNPFEASCEGLKLNDERTIAAASAGMF